MRRERGFSLVELLVVIAIIGILASTVAIKVSHHLATARITTARSDLVTIEGAVETYRLETGRLPDGIEDLLRPVGAAKEPLLRRVPKDPWGRPYLFERTGRRTYVLRTLGADGEPGGEGEDADLSSEDEQD